MKSNPEFSIIIPVYNTVKELERCVSSILSQTFTDFEIILVDDGSTDGSGELCDALVNSDCRIKCIHRENSGCSEARNTGVRSAVGEYLFFVDSDDMWSDNKALSDIYTIINGNTSVDVVCFGVSIYNEKGELVKIRKPEQQFDKIDDKEFILCNLIYSNQYFSTSYVKALKRDFFIKNNLFFVKGLLSEDIEWSSRVLISSNIIKTYPKAFYKRIQRSEGSITSTIGRKNILDILWSIEQGIEYVNKHSENDSFKELYYEYWAYQYAMLLILVAKMKNDSDYSQVIVRLKKLKWLLKYDHVRKVRLVKIVVSAFGIKMATRILAMYYNLKK